MIIAECTVKPEEFCQALVVGVSGQQRGFVPVNPDRELGDCLPPLVEPCSVFGTVSVRVALL